jgi:hypothetical protein
VIAATRIVLLRVGRPPAGDRSGPPAAGIAPVPKDGSIIAITNGRIARA